MMNNEAIELLKEVANEYNFWGHPSVSYGIVMSRGDELREEAAKCDRRDALKHRVCKFIKSQS